MFLLGRGWNFRLTATHVIRAEEWYQHELKLRLF